MDKKYYITDKQTGELRKLEEYRREDQYGKALQLGYLIEDIESQEVSPPGE